MVLAHQQPNAGFVAVSVLVAMLAKNAFKEECEVAETDAVGRDLPGGEGELEKSTRAHQGQWK